MVATLTFRNGDHQSDRNFATKDEAMSEAVSLIESLGLSADARLWSIGASGMIFAPKDRPWSVVISIPLVTGQSMHYRQS
jgi:hypothetical protein